MSEPLNESDRELERALGCLRPPAAVGDPAELAFEAGRRRGRRSARLWQGTTAALIILLAFSSLYRPVAPSSPLPPSAFVAGQSLAQSATSADRPIIGSESALALRNQVLERGLGALSAAPAVRRPAASDIDIEQLLGIPVEQSGVAGRIWIRNLQPVGRQS